MKRRFGFASASSCNYYPTASSTASRKLLAPSTTIRSTFLSLRLLRLACIVGVVGVRVVGAAMAMSTSSCNLPPPRVAIIGAGAAGLAAARAFTEREKKYQVTVLEQSDAIGGVWRYKEGSKHHPMYRNLRTNLPKEIMAFREYPFPTSSLDNTTTSANSRSFVTHRQVLEYLQSYCRTFQLEQFLRLNTRVDQLTVVPNSHSSWSHDCDWPKIQLQYTTQTSTDQTTTTTELFDAVCICNGHYSLPFLPNNNNLPGIDQFQGQVRHSIEYDTPEEFHNLRVLCVGGRASGSDIARELVGHAAAVYLSTSDEQPDQEIEEEEEQDNGASSTTATTTTTTWAEPQTLHGITLLPRTTRIVAPKTVEFGTTTATHKKKTIQIHDIDVIIFCTGYEYSFPFINAEESNLHLEFGTHRRVMPLVEQLWHPQVPNLAFVGLPHSILPFPLFELQVQACRHQWSNYNTDHDDNNNNNNHNDNTNAWSLDRMAAALRDAQHPAGGPPPLPSSSSSSSSSQKKGRIEDTHYLGSAQWEYCRTMAKYAGLDQDPQLAAYLKTNQAIYENVSKARSRIPPGGPDSYRYLKYKRDDVNQSFSVVVLDDTTATTTTTTSSSTTGSASPPARQEEAEELSYCSR